MKHALDEKYFIQSVKQAMNILRLYTPKKYVWSIKQMADRLQLPKSTVHRYVKVLVSFDYLKPSHKQGYYELGLALLTLTGVLHREKSMYVEALPILKKVVQQFGVPAHLCTLENDRLVYLHREHANYAHKLKTYAGRNHDIHCTAEGMIILAFQQEKMIARILQQPRQQHTAHTIVSEQALRHYLKEIRKQHFAVMADAIAENFVSIAVPIKDYNEDIVASLAIVGHIDDMQQPFTQYKKPLHQYATQISALLGYYN